VIVALFMLAVAVKVAAGCVIASVPIDFAIGVAATFLLIIEFCPL